MTKKLKTVDPSFTSEAEENSEFRSVVITQLKERLVTCESYREKLFVLSVLPKTWTARKIASEMDVTRYLAQKTKEWVSKKGILCMPTPNIGKKLDSAVVQAVKSFYLSDDISRVMPGLRDYKMCTVDNEKQSVCISHIILFFYIIS